MRIGERKATTFHGEGIMRNIRRCKKLLLSLALTAGMALQAAGAGHVTIGKDAEPLRATFNADVGKVRVVMLVSPT